MFIIRFFKSILFFVNWISLCSFYFLSNTNILCSLLLYFDQDVIGRLDFFFSCPFYFFPYSRLSSSLLRLYLCLISFLLFECLGQHSCMSSPCPIAILNGTFLLSLGEIVCLGRSFVFQNQIKIIIIYHDLNQIKLN